MPAPATSWTWTVQCDDPDTPGRRAVLGGEITTPAGTTETEVRQRLYPEITARLRRRYGPGARIEDLHPEYRITPA
ncbi:hypothetical protein [Streptomyces sp. NPDC059783]|uniref:hypothetical protein n=1 Tax=Streptomyces sp. NPDC059783 TaxID=3346944 RepID=UPI0036687C8D